MFLFRLFLRLQENIKKTTPSSNVFGTEIHGSTEYLPRKVVVVVELVLVVVVDEVI